MSNGFNAGDRLRFRDGSIYVVLCGEPTGIAVERISRETGLADSSVYFGAILIDDAIKRGELTVQRAEL